MGGRLDGAVRRPTRALLSLGVGVALGDLLAHDIHLKRNGPKVFEKDLSADNVTLRRERRPVCNLTEALSEVCQIEEKTGAAIYFRDATEGLLGIYARSIKRTATRDGSLVGEGERDAEITQALGVNKCCLNIITLWPQWRPLLERVRNNDDFLYGALLSFLGHMTKQCTVLRPAWPMLNCRYGPRQFLCVAVPLVRELQLWRLPRAGFLMFR